MGIDGWFGDFLAWRVFELVVCWMADRYFALDYLYWLAFYVVSVTEPGEGGVVGGVVFSGADGSGKSTVASALRGYLLFRGVGVCLHWFRGSHLFVSVLLRFLSRFNSFHGLCNPYYLVCIPRSLRRAWAFLEFPWLPTLPPY